MIKIGKSYYSARNIAVMSPEDSKSYDKLLFGICIGLSNVGDESNKHSEWFDTEKDRDLALAKAVIDIINDKYKQTNQII